MHSLKGERMLMRIHIGERDHFLELSADLPIVVECVETEERSKRSFPSSTRRSAAVSSHLNEQRSSCIDRRSRLIGEAKTDRLTRTVILRNSEGSAFSVA